MKHLLLVRDNFFTCGQDYALTGILAKSHSMNPSLLKNNCASLLSTGTTMLPVFLGGS